MLELVKSLESGQIKFDLSGEFTADELQLTFKTLLKTNGGTVKYHLKLLKFPI